MFEMSLETLDLKLTGLQREMLLEGQFLDRDLARKIEAGEPGLRAIAFTVPELERLRDRVDRIRDGAKVADARRYGAVIGRIDKCLVRRRADEERRAAGVPEQPGPVRGLVFQFTVTLAGIDPPIWRRFQVEDCTLDRFHHVVRVMVGWTMDVEPHRFEFGGVQYGPRTYDDTPVPGDHVDEATVFLHQLFPAGAAPSAGRYEYEFRARWQHELAFEGHRDWDFDADYPACLGGERACPPEESGGVEGYRQFLEGRSTDPKRILDSVPPSRRPFRPDVFDRASLAEDLKEIDRIVFRQRRTW